MFKERIKTGTGEIVTLKESSMKALILEEYNRLKLCDIDKPKPNAGDVIIKVEACAICGSDIHGIDGSTGRRIPPVVMGHEASGTIHETGSGVTGFKKGDRVTFDSTVYCGECDYCRKGRINLCNNRRVLGVSCDEYRQNGAFAEYVRVPSRILYKLPDNVTFESAAMTEPLTIALHAVNRACVSMNADVLIIGAGTIGLLVVQLLAHMGCKKIIIVDINKDRLNLAKDLGATDIVISSEERVSEKVMDITENSGVDTAVEAVGIEQTIKTAVESVKKGGTLVLVGNLVSSVNMPLQKIITREINIKGSCASAGEYKECLDIISGGIVKVAPLISKVVPLKDGAKWMDRLYRGEHGLIKVILKP